MLVYSNLVKLVNSNVRINVGNGYGFDSNNNTNKDLDVDKNSIFEAISNNEAVHGNNYFQITDDTKELGVLVNKEASKEGAEVWDEESFNSYKYVRIPGSHTLTIVWTSIDGDELMKTIEVTTEVGNTVSKAVEDVELFEKDGYEALGLFVEKQFRVLWHDIDDFTEITDNEYYSAYNSILQESNNRFFEEEENIK